MKKVKCLSLAITCWIIMTSCSTYVQTYTVGKGPQKNEIIRKKNHYILYGAVPIKTASPTKMADGSPDYEVIHKVSFWDTLLANFALGLYNPTTTIVVK